MRIDVDFVSDLCYLVTVCSHFTLDAERMKRLFLGGLCLLTLSCSSQRSTREDAVLARIQKIASESASLSDTIPPARQPVPTLPNGITSEADSQYVGVEGMSDTLETESALVSKRLELARQHYLAALGSQESGDSTLAYDEFEAAIGILNELIYHDDIESNKDFIDLDSSVVGDYSKYLDTHPNIPRNVFLCPSERAEQRHRQANRARNQGISQE